MSDQPGQTVTPPAGKDSSLKSDSLHTLITKVVSIGLGVLTSIVISRTLGADGKGVVDLVVATMTLLVMVLGFSLPTGITYVVAQLRAKLRPLTLQLALIIIVQSIVAAGVLVVIRLTPLSKAILPETLGAASVYLIALAVLFTMACEYWRSVLIGQHRIKYTNIVDIARRGFYVITIGAGYLVFRDAAGNFDPLIVVWLVIAAALFGNVLYTGSIAGFLRDRGADSGMREIARFSWPCYLGNLGQYFNYRLDIFFVNYYWGEGAVGLYALAVSLVRLIWLIPRSIATVLLPRIAAGSDDKHESIRQAAFLARFSFWASVVIVVPLVVLVPYLLPMVWGAEFAGSVEPFMWLLPGILTFSVTIVLASYIAGVGKPYLNMWISILALVLTVVFDILLIPKYNINGAAIASSISYTFSAVATVVMFVRLTGCPPMDVVLIRPSDIASARGLIRDALKKVNKVINGRGRR